MYLLITAQTLGLSLRGSTHEDLQSVLGLREEDTEAYSLDKGTHGHGDPETTYQPHTFPSFSFLGQKQCGKDDWTALLLQHS